MALTQRYERDRQDAITEARRQNAALYTRLQPSLRQSSSVALARHGALGNIASVLGTLHVYLDTLSGGTPTQESRARYPHLVRSSRAALGELTALMSYYRTLLMPEEYQTTQALLGTLTSELNYHLQHLAFPSTPPPATSVLPPLPSPLAIRQAIRQATPGHGSGDC